MGNVQPVGAPAPAKPNAHLPRNVWALAWVAFFNDTSTEMGYWLLPQFLVAVLGAPPMAFGLIEGAAETIASFSRLLSGWLSDLTGLAQAFNRGRIHARQHREASAGGDAFVASGFLDSLW